MMVNCHAGDDGGNEHLKQQRQSDDHDTSQRNVSLAELNVGSREEQAAALPPPLPPSQQSS